MTTIETSALRDRMAGQVVTPADAGYDEARAIYNGMIDRPSPGVARSTTSAPRSTTGGGPGWRSRFVAVGTTGPGSAPSRAAW